MASEERQPREGVSGSPSITRRRFLTGLACSSLCAVAGQMLSSCQAQQMPGSPSSPPTTAGGKTAEPEPTVELVPGSGQLPLFTREALYYSALDPKSGKSRVRCELCPRQCVIAEGDRGECGVREAQGETLYTLVYGRACAVHADPIEKKPFYHFLPGSLAFSLATAGCNLHCLYCQNWQISQQLPEAVESLDLPPEKVVASALEYECPVVAYTYSEPTIFYEYMLDTARVARTNHLRNVVISAGYINPEPLSALCHAVDAIKIDFKGYSRDFYTRICGATLQPVLETMKLIHDEGVHLEIVTLVVPTLNDDAEQLQSLCHWIVEELGPDVPTHFSRFHPLYKLTHLPMTPVETLEEARDIAMEEGIHYAYVGNVPGHPGDNTYCHQCGELIIRRLGFSVLEMHLVDGQCEYCGQPIPGVWK
jgi:pyruvate formate lyase activating enzyme